MKKTVTSLASLALLLAATGAQAMSKGSSMLAIQIGQGTADVVDPRQGVIFYTLDQQQSGKPQFQRREECLQCHVSSGTLGVPGGVVRSVHADQTGMPLFQMGTFVTDHRSPLSR